jgi:hypothetical protein
LYGFLDYRFHAPTSIAPKADGIVDVPRVATRDGQAFALYVD